VPIAQMAEKLRVLKLEGGDSPPSLRPIELAQLDAIVKFACAWSPKERALRAMRQLLVYLEDEQLFDDRDTRELLLPQGIVVPPVDEYLARVFAYHRTHHDGQSERASVRLDRAPRRMHC
jgi:hypothetical protein